MPRRRLVNYVSLLIAALACSCLSGQEPEPEAKPRPTAGDEVAQFAAVDAWMQEFMQSKKIPGGSLAIAIDGEIKLARGYGYADREQESPVQPDSLFRIASISKPITAVAVLKLVDVGKLKLDDKIVELLKLSPHPGPLPQGARESRGDYDPWWNEVTLHHLLTHTGGWDRNRSGDPMFMDEETVNAFSASGAPSSRSPAGRMRNTCKKKYSRRWELPRLASAARWRANEPRKKSSTTRSTASPIPP